MLRTGSHLQIGLDPFVSVSLTLQTCLHVLILRAVTPKRGWSHKNVSSQVGLSAWH